MELRHLRYFVEVAHASSYHAAAQRLQIAQPALWQQVQALQHELGTPLFERAGRAVRLTRAGAMLLVYAEHAVAAADQVSLAAEDLRTGRTGMVSIACYSTHLVRFLAEVIGRFERNYPQVRVDIREFPQLDARTVAPAVPESVAALLNGSVDLAVGPRPAGAVEGFQVDEVGIVALVARDHPLAAADQISIGHLRGQPLLFFGVVGSFSARAVRDACYAAGFQPVMRFETGYAAVVAALAEHGVGVGVLAEDAIPEGFGGKLIPIEDPSGRLRRESWLCWRAGSPMPSVVEAFIEETKRTLDEHAGRSPSANC